MVTAHQPVEHFPVKPRYSELSEEIFADQRQSVTVYFYFLHFIFIIRGRCWNFFEFQIRSKCAIDEADEHVRWK